MRLVSAWRPLSRPALRILPRRHTTSLHPRSFSTTSRRRQEERQWSTPLAKQLYEAILTTGPVPLASYMRMCLTGDVGGYYTGAIGEARDQFGTKGDFVTSPEISQIFGELIGIWFIAEWMSQGRPARGVQLIELGPGRGTLMDDVLRTIQRFPAMAKSIDGVFMVEASKELRQAQQKLLCSPGSEVASTDIGTVGTIKHAQTPITWAETLKSIPIDTGKVPFIVAHEFFDALPIHTFQTAPAAHSKPAAGATDSSEKEAPKPAAPQPAALEWREMLVSPTHPGATHEELGTLKAYREDPVAEFQLILSSKSTRHSRFMPETSERYRALKAAPDSVIEICPDASLYASDIATRIGGSPEHPKAAPSGAALILDYGTSDTVPINSLRGIRHHKLVNPLSAPGLVDLSADVDFTAVADAATLASEGVEVHGPVTQADFLGLMGIQQRAEMLAKTAGVDGKAAENIEKAWKRLVDRGPNGMGKVYKVLAVLPENGGARRPVGFGGDVRQ